MAGEFIADNVFDNGLSYANTNVETLHINSQVATTYTEASSTYLLGTKTSYSVGAPTNPTAGTGRAVVGAAITDGSVSGSALATHWAWVKTSATSELIATGPLATSQTVTNGNTFTLDTIECIIRDATVT